MASVYRAVFWFHPLAWWLHKEIAELAEAASDDAALAATRDETLYAEILLHFFATAPRRVQWDAVAMATQGKATKRGTNSRHRTQAVPWIDARHAGRARTRRDSRGLPRIVRHAGLGAGSRSGSAGGSGRAGSAGCQPGLTPAPPAPPPAPAIGVSFEAYPACPHRCSRRYRRLLPDRQMQNVPRPPRPPRPPRMNWNGDSFAIISDDHTNMNGSFGPGDAERLKRIRKQAGKDILWFRRGSGEYIIRDPALVAQAKQAIQSLEDQGKKMGEKGEMQGEYARKMAEQMERQMKPKQAEMERVGREMEKIGEEMSRAVENNPEMKRLEQKMKELEKEMEVKSKAFEDFNESSRRGTPSWRNCRINSAKRWKRSARRWSARAKRCNSR